MGTVGFGGYRISSKSAAHKAALLKAINAGVQLIDTSSNYTDGESEELIGSVLCEANENPLIISKVGYVQGKNLAVLTELNEQGKAIDDLVIIDENLKHSIHPEFIEDQIKRSLERLQLKTLDIYLLHNPEYYLQTAGSSKQEYYRRIKKAFQKMEELVERGLIKYYGISSNTFIDPREDHMATDLDIVFGAARDISINNHFKYIQFPMNLLEMGALERQYDGNHLIERANSFGLKTIINRPLNSFSEQGLVRLATYPVGEEYYEKEFADKIFNKCIEPLVIKWFEVREDDGDKLFDIPVLKQINSIWYQQHSQDAVDQVFMGYFFPLIANIWGRDLSPKESHSFYELYEHAIEFAKKNMSHRAIEFERQAINKGLLFESDKSLSQKVIEKYQTFGIDYILIGMRSEEYVTQMKNYF